MKPQSRFGLGIPSLHAVTSESGSAELSSERLLQQATPEKKNHLSWDVDQARNQSDNIRNEYDKVVLEYEGALDRREVSTTPSDFDYCFVRAGRRTQRH